MPVPDAPRRRPRPLRVVLLIAASLVAFTAFPVKAAQDDLRLEVARQWAEKGEYEKAVQELRLFLNEHPEAAEVYARIGSLRLRQGKLKQAAESFKVALQKNPSLPEAKDGMAKVRELESQPPPEPTPAVSAPAKGAQLPDNRGTGSAPAGNAGPPEPTEPADQAGFSPSQEPESPSTPQGIYALEDFQQAWRQYREGKPDLALVSLKKVLAGSPGHPGAYYLGGVIRYEKGDLAKAAYNFKRSFGYPERGFNAHFYLGRINQRQNRIPEAIGHFEKYLAATRSEAGRKQVESILAQLKAKAGKVAESAPAPGPDKLVSPHGPADSTAHAREAAAPAQGKSEPGHAAHGAKDSSEAPGAIRSAAEKTPSGSERSSSGSERIPSPLVLGLEGSPPFVVADSAGASGKQMLEAYEAFRKEKFEKSADLLKETIRLYGGSPNAEAADLDLASVYLRLGLWDNARDRILSYLSSARQPQRYRDLAFYLEGLMHLGRKDGEKAERALLKVKAGSFGGPSQDEIDWRLAQAGELMKDMKKWAAYLERAQASAPTALRKARLRQQLGQLHGKHGRPERALEFYRKSLEGCGKAGQGGQGGQADDAAAGWDTLCQESKLRIADLEFRRKNWKEALAGYRAFASEFPDHKEAPWAQYQIGNVYQATRNLESALNQYKKVIDNYPDSYWASQAQWKREDAIWRKEYEEVLD